MANSNALFGGNVGNNNSSNNTNKENNNMNAANGAIKNNGQFASTADFAFENRRQWQPSGWDQRLNFTEETVKTMTPNHLFEQLINDGTIRFTQATNLTRAEGIPVVFTNNVELQQMGAMLALRDTIPYVTGREVDEKGFRVIAMYDTMGNHHIVVHEERNMQSGHIDYSCYYGTPTFNNHGQPNGLDEGKLNKVNEAIFAKVQSYNEWVDRHDAAVKAMAMGLPLDSEQQALVKNVKPGENPNHFVQINSVTHHINYSSVIHKYALLAMVLEAEKVGGVAFEIYTRAGKAETMQKFLDGRSSKMVWGYQGQLKVLSGIKYQEQQ